MKKDSDNIMNFDLSALSLNELITLYENIASFQGFLRDIRIETENKEGEQNG